MQKLKTRLGYLPILMIMALVLALACAAGAQTPTYTIPDVSGFHATFTDTQTFANDLVTGPGRDAIYVGLVMAGFAFVWRMIRKGLGSH